jgi:hypothetical protein
MHQALACDGGGCEGYFYGGSGFYTYGGSGFYYGSGGWGGWQNENLKSTKTLPFFK